MGRWGAAGLGLLGVLVGAGCGDEGAGDCFVLGERVPLGGTVEDRSEGLRCVCRAEGPGCTSFTPDPDGGRLVDLGGGAGGEGGGAGPTGEGGAGAAGGAAGEGGAGAAGGAGGVGGEGGLGGEGGEGGVAGAGGEGGGAPDDACPGNARPLGQCATEGATCGYGEPARCCDNELPFQHQCTCTENLLWRCADQLEVCRSNAATADCERREAVCAARAVVIDQVNDGVWGFDALACDRDEMDEAWRDEVVRHLNAWRVLANQPPVTRDANRDRAAQACAVALEARGAITHDLGVDEPCHTAAAAQAARGGLIHSRPAVAALRDYIWDWGEVNFAGLPHRLWMLSNTLGTVGVGSTDGYSCLYVANGGGRGDQAWTAWPGPGPFPYDAHFADQTGWTVQSNTVRLFGARVEVTRNGQVLPVVQRFLAAQGGASFGLAFVPDGWQSEPDTRYHVRLNGLDPVIEYDVDLVDCAAPRP